MLNLPDTPIPVVFKSNRLMNKALKARINTIPGNTQMGQLPQTSIIVMHNGYCTRYRLTGIANYSYAEMTISKGYNNVHLSGSTDDLEILDSFLHTVNTIRPFVANLYKQ